MKDRYSPSLMQLSSDHLSTGWRLGIPLFIPKERSDFVIADSHTSMPAALRACLYIKRDVDGSCEYIKRRTDMATSSMTGVKSALGPRLPPETM